MEDEMAPTPREIGTIMNVVDLFRGGPIQRRVWRAFIANPDRELTTAELATWAYPRLQGDPERKHRWAIVRRSSARYGDSPSVTQKWPLVRFRCDASPRTAPRAQNES